MNSSIRTPATASVHVMQQSRVASFRVSLAALVLSGFCGQLMLHAEEGATSVAVADTSTFVNIAKVYLSVGSMTVDDGQLVGSYSIDVPLRKSKSEKGSIKLALKKDIGSYLSEGGTISGEGQSDKKIEDNKRRIDARFSPFDPAKNSGRIELTIETSQRVLKFESTYTLSGETE